MGSKPKPELQLFYFVWDHSLKDPITFHSVVGFYDIIDLKCVGQCLEKAKLKSLL